MPKRYAEHSAFRKSSSAVSHVFEFFFNTSKFPIRFSFLKKKVSIWFLFWSLKPHALNNIKLIDWHRIGRLVLLGQTCRPPNILSLDTRHTKKLKFEDEISNMTTESEDMLNHSSAKQLIEIARASSQCEIVELTFECTIPDFNLLPHGNDQYLATPSFFSNGHPDILWYLVIYPRGNNEQFRGFTSLFLGSVGPRSTMLTSLPGTSRQSWRLIDCVVTTVCNCFTGTPTDESVQLQIIKVLHLILIIVSIN